MALWFAMRCIGRRIEFVWSIAVGRGKPMASRIYGRDTYLAKAPRFVVPVFFPQNQEDPKDLKELS